MKNDFNQIIVKLKELLPLVKNKYEVDAIELFGSYARKEQRIGSDLDLLVTSDKIPGLVKFLELKNFLSDQLNVNVDLVMKDALKPRLRNTVISESISL